MEDIENRVVPWKLEVVIIMESLPSIFYQYVAEGERNTAPIPFTAKHDSEYDRVLQGKMLLTAKRDGLQNTNSIIDCRTSIQLYVQNY